MDLYANRKHSVGRTGDADGVANADADGNTNSNSNTNTNSNSNTNAYSNANAYTNHYANSNTDGYADSDANRDTCGQYGDDLLQEYRVYELLYPLQAGRLDSMDHSAGNANAGFLVLRLQSDYAPVGRRSRADRSL